MVSTVKEMTQGMFAAFAARAMPCASPILVMVKAETGLRRHREK